MKRKQHKPSDKAARLAEIISLKPLAPVEQPSEKIIAEMIKGLSFTIGRKGIQTNEQKTDDEHG